MMPQTPDFHIKGELVAFKRTRMTKRAQVNLELDVWKNAAEFQMNKARSEMNTSDYAFYNGYLMGLNDARFIFARIK